MQVVATALVVAAGVDKWHDAGMTFARRSGAAVQRTVGQSEPWHVQMTVRSFLNVSMELVECFSDDKASTITQMPTSLPAAQFRKDIGMWVSSDTVLKATGKGLEGPASGRCIFKLPGVVTDPPSPWYTWCVGHNCDDFFTGVPTPYEPGLGEDVGVFNQSMTMCICMPEAGCDADCVTPNPPPKRS